MEWKASGFKKRNEWEVKRISKLGIDNNNQGKGR